MSSDICLFEQVLGFNISEGDSKIYRLQKNNNFIFPVAIRLGETPVPIPNTMVKTQAADGTILETIWESRWLPDNIYGYIICSRIMGV